jgi:hypothetical protein
MVIAESYTEFLPQFAPSQVRDLHQSSFLSLEPAALAPMRKQLRADRSGQMRPPLRPIETLSGNSMLPVKIF